MCGDENPIYKQVGCFYSNSVDTAKSCFLAVITYYKVSFQNRNQQNYV
jgi:hypothetical protein